MNFFVLLLILSLSSSMGAVEITPTIRLNQSLSFQDDLNFEKLNLAIKRQMVSFEHQGLNGEIRFGTDVYPKKVLKDSLLLLKQFANDALKCQKERLRLYCRSVFNRKMNDHFAIYIPVKEKSSAETKFTAYYSPDFNGSRVPTERFKRAIYRKPPAPEDNYTRAEIDYKGALLGKGYEVFWVEESFYDLYLLHVQGGGRINVFDREGNKEVKYLSYAGKNSKPFRMVYHYMLSQGYIKPQDSGVPAQRRFLEANPDKEEEIFGTCPSYVYFNESNQEPVGLNNIPLTEGRSLAIDNRIYKTMGMINFVKTKKATHVDQDGRVVKVPFARFFISQDTGGAIRGNARCDLYFGYGPQAELAAYNMNEIGEQYFLIKK